ncbi:Rnf-Nqr domain containing protein, partial [Klebsiella pneumoniae]
YENRMRLPVEIVRRVREAVGPNFIIIYRLSMLDLVEGGSTWDEIVLLAKAIEQAGATLINTGIGWHEARIPTIATKVPRAAFTKVTAKLKGEVSIPLITTNCVILGRADGFAAKHDPARAAYDGLMMGLGFGIVLVLIGAIRELLGTGALFANMHLLFG